MNENSLTQQVKQVIREAYERIRDQVEVSVELVSAEVMRQLDPLGAAPPLIGWLATLEARQLARSIVRKTIEEADDLDESTVDLFGAALQRRYPTERDGQFVYVLREHLTLEEREANEAALRSEAEAKLKHADAFRAETEYLRTLGRFDKAA